MSMRMESMTFVSSWLLVTFLVLTTIGTCRAYPSIEDSAQQATDGEQSLRQFEELQREWDDLMYRCRGLLPIRSVRRLGSEFLGKRSPLQSDPFVLETAFQWCANDGSSGRGHWLCRCLYTETPERVDSDDEIAENEWSPPPSVSKRGLGAILLSGKRMNTKWGNALNRRIMGSEFLGKRAIPLGSEFLGKRAIPLGSEFLGKRSNLSPKPDSSA